MQALRSTHSHPMQAQHLSNPTPRAEDCRMSFQDGRVVLHSFMYEEERGTG